ncbi:MAG: hypothetical protein ABT940_12690 [Alphaproteobacteria bacterium]
MNVFLPVFFVILVVFPQGGQAASPSHEATSPPARRLEATFAESGFGYTLQYPAGWRITRPGRFAVVFGGAPETAAFYTTVSLDNRLSPHPGEPRRGASAILSLYLKELGAKARGVRVETQVPFLYRQDDVALDGYQAVTEFDGQTERMRQWTVVIPRRSGTVVHVWMFTAPFNEFERALPTARAILDSWRIRGTDAE